MTFEWCFINLHAHQPYYDKVNHGTLTCLKVTPKDIHLLQYQIIYTSSYVKDLGSLVGTIDTNLNYIYQS